MLLFSVHPYKLIILTKLTYSADINDLEQVMVCGQFAHKTSVRKQAVTAARSLGQENAPMDSNHSSSNAFQLTNNICSHSHSGDWPYVLQSQSADDERWMCDYLLPEQGKLTVKIKIHKSWRCFTYRLDHMRLAEKRLLKVTLKSPRSHRNKKGIASLTFLSIWFNMNRIPEVKWRGLPCKTER